MRRAAAITLKAIAALAVALATVWISLAAYWSDIPGEAARIALAAAIPIATLLAFAFARRKGRMLLAWSASFALFVFWWSSIEPSNNGSWQRDVAVLPYASIQGDTVTFHNVRDFAYRTETDYQPRYYDKAYDLSKLDSVDLIAVYWMGDAIAHVMMSFGFEGKDYLCFSIETRKRQGQEYTSLKGFFKQYTLTYVVADERDLIRLRTDYRNPTEDVYVYRTRMPRESACKLFLEYVKEINSLRDRAQFYNTLTTNCTTNVVRHIRTFSGNVSYNWKILLSGYAPQYVYELGGLDTSLPFPELRAKSHVNAKARAIGDAPDFSARLREGLPGMRKTFAGPDAMQAP